MNKRQRKKRNKRFLEELVRGVNELMKRTSTVYEYESMASPEARERLIRNIEESVRSMLPPDKDVTTTYMKDGKAYCVIHPKRPQPSFSIKLISDPIEFKNVEDGKINE